VEKLTNLRQTDEKWKAELKFEPWHPPGVMCVCVSPPPQRMCAKYHLPVFRVQGQVQMTHVLTMEHLGKAQIDAFIAEWDACLVEQVALAEKKMRRPSAGWDAWQEVVKKLERDAVVKGQSLTGSKFNKINAIGFGTFKLSGDDCMKAVSEAQAAGYSLLDTATVYKNLQDLGEIKARMQICHKIDFHISTGHELADQFAKDLLQLQVSSVHVLMLHYFPKEHCDRQDMWVAVLNEKRQGKAKFVGVSNFTIENLEFMFGDRISDEWPDIVQVHISICTEDFIEYCHSKEIDIMVYGALRNGSLEAARNVVRSGVAVLVSSTRRVNIHSNFDTLASYMQ